MSIIKPTFIENWPKDLRWCYGNAEYELLEGVKLRGDLTGTLTFRFRPTFRQRLAILFGRGIYVSAMTFAQPLQPLRIDAGEPDFIAANRPHPEPTP